MKQTFVLYSVNEKDGKREKKKVIHTKEPLKASGGEEDVNETK